MVLFYFVFVRFALFCEFFSFWTSFHLFWPHLSLILLSAFSLFQTFWPVLYVFCFFVVFIYLFVQSWVYSIWWLWIRLNHSTADLHWDNRNVPTQNNLSLYSHLKHCLIISRVVVCHQIGLTSLPFQSSPSLLGSVPVHYSIISIKTICFIKIYGLCFLRLGPVSLSSLSWFSLGLPYSISWGTSPQVALLVPFYFCSWSLH